MPLEATQSSSSRPSLTLQSSPSTRYTGGTMKSRVWEHYEETSSTSATCNHCKRILKRSLGSTTNLSNHLKIIHGIVLEKKVQGALQEEDESTGTGTAGATQAKKQKTIDSYLKRESLEEILSKLVAVSGFSMHAVAKCSFIEEAIKAKGYKIPY